MCVVGTEDICIDTPVAYDELPSAGRRKELRQLLHVLQPLKRVTVTLQGEKYVTLSAVYPHVQFMLLGLKRLQKTQVWSHVCHSSPRSSTRCIMIHEIHQYVCVFQ